MDRIYVENKVQKESGQPQIQRQRRSGGILVYEAFNLILFLKLSIGCRTIKGDLEGSLVSDSKLKFIPSCQTQSHEKKSLKIWWTYPEKPVQQVKAGSAGPAQLHRVMHRVGVLCPTLKAGSAGLCRLSRLRTTTASLVGGGINTPSPPSTSHSWLLLTPTLRQKLLKHLFILSAPL